MQTINDVINEGFKMIWSSESFHELVVEESSSYDIIDCPHGIEISQVIVLNFISYLVGNLHQDYLTKF